MPRLSAPSKRSFTLVELCMGMILTAIFCLTAGTFLYYVVMISLREQVKVNVQRDATHALDMFDRTIHEASDTQITVSGSTLTVSHESFYLNASQIMYDPDTSASGDETALTGPCVNSLSFSKDSTARDRKSGV